MNRVLKKISTPFEQFKPNAAILMINLVDPQINTLKVFLEAVEKEGLPYFVVGNKADLVEEEKIKEIKKELRIDVLTSMVTREGIEEVKKRVGDFKDCSRIAILGIFNSGKTSLISELTGKDLKISDLPGTTLEFTEHAYGDFVLIDTIGQIIDINKPMMVSIDLSGCSSREEKVKRILNEDASGILATLEIAVPAVSEVVEVIKKQIEAGNKIVVTGAGASALVAMEMAGQGLETGLPIIVLTNNFADAQPVSFSKGIGEEETGLSKYIDLVVNKGDVVVGISASGGTGFVYDALKRGKEKGTITIAITENVDTPLGKAADYIIKSNAKPEGPSSSKIQVAHLAIVHALLLTLADERGITADQSIEFMMPEKVATKKMGIK